MSSTYTATVRRYFTEHRPQAMAQLGTPEETEAYFRRLGQQIEEQVQMGADQIAGPIVVGESPQQKAGRRSLARSQAEEIALADLLYGTPPETDDEESTARGRSLLQMRREMVEANDSLNAQLDRELAAQTTS